MTFSFNTTSILDKANEFRKQVETFSQESDAYEFLAHAQAWNFAAEPWKEINESVELFETNMDRHKRQAALGAVVVIGLASIGTSAWALSEANNLKSTVSQVQSNQAMLAHHVDGLAHRLEEHDELFKQVNGSLELIKQSDKRFTLMTGYYGYFSATRNYTRSVNTLCLGMEAVLDHRITSKLIPLKLARSSMQELVNKGKTIDMNPVFPEWQQVYLHEVAFAYDKPVLNVIYYTPFSPASAEEYELYQFFSTPWFYNSSLLEFLPEHDVVLVKKDAKTVTLTISMHNLESCRRIGAKYLCETPVTEQSQVDDCLTSLFYNNFAQALKICKLQYLPLHLYTFPLNRTSTLIFSPTVIHVQEICPGEIDQLYALSGLQVVVTNHSCVLQSEEFRLVMGGSAVIHEEVIIHSHRFNDSTGKPITMEIPTLSPLKPFRYGDVHRDIKAIEMQDTIGSNMEWIEYLVLGFILSKIVAVIGWLAYRYCFFERSVNKVFSARSAGLTENINLQNVQCPAPEMANFNEKVKSEIKNALADSEIRESIESLVFQALQSHLRDLGLTK